MTKIAKFFCLFISLLALTFPHASYAGDFNIKEYEIGMPIERHPTWPPCRADKNGSAECFDSFNDFTIGGEKVPSVFMRFDERLASSIMFSFSADSFNAIRTSVLTKYKNIKCKKEEVSNAMGAKFMNEICSGKTATESISLEKYSGSLSSGSLLMISHAQAAKNAEKSKAKTGDI